MRIWKFLALGVFLAMGAACDTGGIRLGDAFNTCRVGAPGACPAGQYCTGASAGQWGYCEQNPPLRDVGDCHVGDNSPCAPGETCIGIASPETGAPGHCQPPAAACADGGTVCPTGQSCVEEGGIRECKAEPNACQNGGTYCPGGLLCYQNACERPEEVPCQNGGTYCSAGLLCYQNACERPEDVSCQNGGTYCTAGLLCYQNACERPEDVSCQNGGTYCTAGLLCYQNACELPEEVPCQNGGTYCSAGLLCYQNDCERPEEVPCQNGGTYCSAGLLCYQSDCELPEDVSCQNGGTYCSAGLLCYQNACELPEEVPCQNGGTYCSAGLLCYQSDCELPEEVPCQNGGTYCSAGLLCYQNACELPEEVPCESGGTYCPAGESCEESVCQELTSLSGFQLFIGEQLVTPLRADGATEDNPDAGWVGLGEAEIRLSTQGAEAMESLYVRTSQNPTPLACKARCTANPTTCEWSCALPAAWAGTGPRIEVLASIESEAAQVWTYQTSLELPQASLEVPSVGVLGETLRVCASATSTFAPLDNILLTQLQLGQSGTALPLSWTEGALAQGEKCWTTTLPLEWTWESVDVEFAITAVDVAGNLQSAVYGAPLRLTRISCEIATANGVNAPLTFVQGRLVFSAGNSLHFIDADTCLEVGAPLQTGNVIGPMVALENGNLAVATTGTGGPAGRTSSRLLVVDATATQPGFASAAAEDCAVGAANTHVSSAHFDKGLSLLGSNPLRLAAPANTSNDAVLVAYMPSAATAAERCMATPTPLPAPVALTPPQSFDAWLVVVHENIHTRAEWAFDENGYWADNPSTFNDLTEGTLSGIALNGGSFWLSAYTSSPHHALQFFERWTAAPLNTPLSPIYRTGPAAVDSWGRAYVVGYETLGGSRYDLVRLNSDGTVEAIQTLPTGSTGNLVGSPLLGQPASSSNPELYVVRGNGRVFAFDANTLTRLWMMELGFNISQGAQPVLVPHAQGGGTLWVVGTQGQVRAIRVASNGLNHTAPWPKAFRDNCNTSNARTTWAHMPSCF